MKSRAILYKEAPDDFACFSRAVLKDEMTREHISIAPHQLEWFDHIDRCADAGKFAGILAPPSSGKSQIFGIGYPLYMMGRRPQIRICVVGADDALVKDRVRPTKDYVQYDPDYRAIFPNVTPDEPDKWTELKFSVKRPRGIKDPTYQGRGIMSPPQGARVDLLVNDDICTYKNTISESAQREKIIHEWYNSFDQRLGPKSFVVHIGGIIHSRDLSSRLMQDPRFWFLKQSIADDFGSIVQENLSTAERKTLPLWSRAWTPDFLREKYKSNARAYRRAYQHIGYSDDERTFKEATVRASIRIGALPMEGEWLKYVGVDLAGRSRKGTVISVVAVKGTRRRVLEIQRGAWSSNETGAKITDVYLRHLPVVIMVENNAYQQALIDWMRATAQAGEMPLPLQPFTTGKQKADEDLGLPGLSAEFENGMWEIPFDEGHVIAMGCECGKCALVSELIEHPFGTSDTVMAVWFARSAALKFQPETPSFSNAPSMGRESFRTRSKAGETRLQSFRSRKRH